MHILEAPYTGNVVHAHTRGPMHAFGPIALLGLHEVHLIQPTSRCNLLLVVSPTHGDLCMLFVSKSKQNHRLSPRNDSCCQFSGRGSIMMQGPR
mmetsp:Transcript_24753/g.68448  ORF Transcript_24753/g.68448 Transcript_24753/m.68448 type:complete len:94 (-) Transcript_24753:553-834(-)